MKILKIIAVIAAILIIAFIAVYAFYGGFSSISVKTEIQGGEILVYEEVTGDYSQTTNISDKVYFVLLDDYKIETTKGFGIYYDNPHHVAKDKLRSEVGCILDKETDSIKISTLPKDLKIKKLPKTDCIVAEIPFKGPLSVVIGVFKVYPAIEEYTNQNEINANGPVMEIYDMPNKKIIYRKMISEK